MLAIRLLVSREFRTTWRNKTCKPASIWNVGCHSAHDSIWFIQWSSVLSNEADLNLVGLAKGLRFRETSSAVSRVDFAEAIRVVVTTHELNVLLVKHSIDEDEPVGLFSLSSLPCSEFKSTGGVVCAHYWLTESHRVDFTSHGSLDGLHFSMAVPSSGDFFVSHVVDVNRRADVDNFVELNRLLADHNLWLAAGDLHLRRWDALLSGRQYWLARGEENWHG